MLCVANGSRCDRYSGLHPKAAGRRTELANVSSTLRIVREFIGLLLPEQEGQVETWIARAAAE